MKRNSYGFPLDIALQKAKRISSHAADRLVDRQCQCSLHRQAAEDEKLRQVQRIIENWK